MKTRASLKYFVNGCSFITLSRIFKSTLFERSLCSARVFPHTIKPSWGLIQPDTLIFLVRITNTSL